MNGLLETLTPQEMAEFSAASPYVEEMRSARAEPQHDGFLQKFIAFNEHNPEVGRAFNEIELLFSLAMLMHIEELRESQDGLEFFTNYFFEIIGGDDELGVGPIFPDGVVNSTGKVAIALYALQQGWLEFSEERV